MHIVRNDAAAAATQAGGLNSVEEILVDLAAGKMVVIMDDEQRENEGDLLMAASLYGRRTSTSWRGTVAA